MVASHSPRVASETKNKDSGFLGGPHTLVSGDDFSLGLAQDM